MHIVCYCLVMRLRLACKRDLISNSEIRLFKDLKQLISKGKVVEGLKFLYFGQMSRNDFHDYKTDDRFWENFSDCKICLNLIDPVFYREVGAASEAFDFALHVTSGSILGSLKGRIIDLEFAFPFEIDYFIAPFLVWVIAWVAGEFAW